MAVNVTIVETLESVNRALNNVTITLRLVWVDPAPSTTRDHCIRVVGSDRTRSMRLTMWSFDDETKDLLMRSIFHMVKWEGLVIRQQKEPYLQREHLFGASCNREDKFNLRFVGRFTVVSGRGEGDFLDVIVPRPVIAAPFCAPSTSGACAPSTPPRTSLTPTTAPPTPKRVREWQCPEPGCKVSAWPYCMQTGRAHPVLCPACGTQGMFRFCPATPRGCPPVLHDGFEEPLLPRSEPRQEPSGAPSLLPLPDISDE